MRLLVGIVLLGISSCGKAPGVIFPPDPKSGSTCDFSKCAFNDAFTNAETTGADEMVAACKEMAGINAKDPCLKGCKVKMQIDTLVKLGKANSSACADELTIILNLEEEREEMELEDEAAEEQEAALAALPHFNCLVGCKGKVKGKLTTVNEKTLSTLTCVDWAPLLFSVKGSKCISKCTVSTKWAIGNSTADGTKKCKEAAAEQTAEQAAEQAQEDAELPNWSCLETCKGPKGHVLSMKAIDALNCSDFDEFVVGTRKQPSCTKSCTVPTKSVIEQLTVGDTCIEQAQEEAAENNGDGAGHTSELKTPSLKLVATSEESVSHRGGGSSSSSNSVEVLGIAVMGVLGTVVAAAVLRWRSGRAVALTSLTLTPDGVAV